MLNIELKLVKKSLIQIELYGYSIIYVEIIALVNNTEAIIFIKFNNLQNNRH